MAGNEDPHNLDATVAEGGRRRREGIGAVDPGPGDRVGAFRLKEQLGRGGMGSVYLAEQLEPVRREVALKLLQGSVLDPTRVARFSVEQQALARMSHPAIAQIYDAGTTADGRPYFAMEHVQGQSITEFCASHGLGFRERLGLFAKVCWGVQHAHQKGIIHRDLKPSNILVRMVDEQPSPKIIDFGIATAVRATSEPSRSGRARVSGTPAYMSPEQSTLAEADLDTRTDIYSLGAVLYELIAGSAPIVAESLRDMPLAELRRILHDTEIEAPSRRVRGTGAESAVLAGSQRRRRRLLRHLRSDVDWIVLKALARDRSQRYPTAADLARDIESFLSGGEVQAVPTTLRYRLIKTAARHKALLAGTAAVTLTLFIGLALATWGFLQAREQRDRAREAEVLARVETAKAEQIAGFIQSILAGVDPGAAGALDKTLVRRILEGASARIASELVDQPEVAAAIHYTIGATYSALGEYDPAGDHLEAAHSLLEQELGAADPQTLTALVELALLRRRQGRFEEAEELYLEAIDRGRQVLGTDHPETLNMMNNLAVLYRNDERLEEAERLHRQVLAESRRVLGPDHPDTLNSLNNLAYVLKARERAAEAAELWSDAAKRARRGLPPDSTPAGAILSNYGWALTDLGRYGEAEAALVEARDLFERTLGPDHALTKTAAERLEEIVRRRGR